MKQFIDKESLENLTISACLNGKTEPSKIILVSKIKTLPTLNISESELDILEHNERKSFLTDKDTWDLIRDFANTADSAADVGFLVQFIERFAPS